MAPLYYLARANNGGEEQFEAPQYWQVYTTNGYEFGDHSDPPNTYGDNDPDAESATPGLCFIAEPEQAIVFLETRRDLGAEKGWSAAEVAYVARNDVVHEMGHQFELDDDVGDNTHVMYASSGPTRPHTFSDADLDRIRDSQYP